MMYGTLCTEFYDADKKFAGADEIHFYSSFFDKKESLILEPMCGSGRLLIPLMQEGFNIHGMDNSIPMLKSCRERAAKLGLKPTLFEQSIENMELPHQYDIILIPLGSYQLLYPRSVAYKALQNFYKHLRPGGKLILDLFVPWESLYQNHEEEFSEKEVALPDGGIIKHKSHDVANKYEQEYYGQSTYEKVINGKVIALESERMHLCWYYRYEMELILEKYKLQNIQYQEKHFMNENHMIFIAEK